MQVSASITYCVSPCEIAATGQFSAQAPQEMQASVILYAIVVYLRLFISDSRKRIGYARSSDILYHNIFTLYRFLRDLIENFFERFLVCGILFHVLEFVRAFYFYFRKFIFLIGKAAVLRG